MKQIIVNADDFGINPVVTSEIERMIEAGAVSSTTVMANGACLEEVARFAQLNPEASFGVHLCLSEFDSLTKSETLHRAGLTNEEGVFVPKAIFQCRYLHKDDVRKAIRDELNAQIDVVTSLGFKISHADSHHHVHTIWPLREIFADVLKEREIKKVRLGGDYSSLRMKAHIVGWLRRLKLNKYYQDNFITTNSFCSYREYVLAKRVQKSEGVIELMCHPGHPGTMYREEMKSVEAKAALVKSDVKLISYNDLY